MVWSINVQRAQFKSLCVFDGFSSLVRHMRSSRIRSSAMRMATWTFPVRAPFIYSRLKSALLNTHAGDMSSEADALDVLMEEYEKQAAADCKAVEERSAKKRNATEQTQVHVLRPLPKHNKLDDLVLGFPPCH